MVAAFLTVALAAVASALPAGLLPAPRTLGQYK